MATSTRLVNLLKNSQLFTPQSRNMCNRIVYTNASAAPAANASAASSEAVKDVPGLSANILGAEEPVGPGASKAGDYKNPEYFNYSVMSYYEAEVEMLQFRLPQPNSAQKYHHLSK